jgi:hypothetical protein
MALQASGAISISELATEFGDTVPNSLSEFYNGGSLVPAIAYDPVTASNLAGSNSANLRTAQFGGYDPAINTTTPATCIYLHQLWADNGSTGTVNRTFVVDKTGTYSIYFAWYSYGFTAPLTVTVNGSQVYYNTLISYNSTVSTTGTFSASAGDTIGIVTSFPSSGWSGHYTYIGGSSATSRSIEIANNSSVPTSGALALSNFYGASA